MRKGQGVLIGVLVASLVLCIIVIISLSVNLKRHSDLVKATQKSMLKYNEELDKVRATLEQVQQERNVLLEEKQVLEKKLADLELEYAKLKALKENLEKNLSEELLKDSSN